jgi:hypothetical protein
MGRLDDHENDDAPDGPGEPTRDALERRIRQLEEENHRLQTELDTSLRPIVGPACGASGRAIHLADGRNTCPQESAQNWRGMTTVQSRPNPRVHF